MPSRTILLLALASAVLLCAAEPATIASVDVAGDSCRVINDSSPEMADRCDLSGFERHGGALILLALVAAGAGFLAQRRDDRLAGSILLAVGLVVLAITLLGDMPQTSETGAIGRDFDGASGQAGLGFFLELTGGVLAILAGVLALTAKRTPHEQPARA
jgi:hypothetical protein